MAWKYHEDIFLSFAAEYGDNQVKLFLILKPKRHLQKIVFIQSEIGFKIQDNLESNTKLALESLFLENHLCNDPLILAKTIFKNYF